MKFKREIDLDIINKLTINGSTPVEYIKSDKLYAIALSDTQNGLDSIELIKTADGLIVSQKSNVFISHSMNTTFISNSESHNVKVIVGAPLLPNSEVAGSGSLYAESLSQSSVQLKVAGSGNIKLSGNIFEIKGIVAGSGNINIKNVNANNLDLQVSGSGNIKCFVDTYITAHVSGSGNIKVNGNPTNRNVSKSGSGNIQFN